MVHAVANPEIEAGDFVSLADVVEQAGVHPRQVRKRLRQAGVELLTDPWDSRRRLVRREDLARMLEPRPVAAKSA